MGEATTRLTQANGHSGMEIWYYWRTYFAIPDKQSQIFLKPTAVVVFCKYLKRINQGHVSAAVEFSAVHNTPYTIGVSEHNTCRSTVWRLSAAAHQLWPLKCGCSTPYVGYPYCNAKKLSRFRHHFFSLLLPRRTCLRIMLEQLKLSFVGPQHVNRAQQAVSVITGNITRPHGCGNIQ